MGFPGFAYSFYPQKGMPGPKHIVCAGDGSFYVWYMVPTRCFQYEIQIIDFPGTTGELLLTDFDGDGIMDILVPEATCGGIYRITFKWHPSKGRVEAMAPNTMQSDGVALQRLTICCSS